MIKWRHPQGTSTYKSTRCYCTTHKAYADYGKQGIKVCARWHDYDNFYDDMGERPEGMTLERIDNNGDYELANCCWATYKAQNRNSRHNVMLTYKGKTQCMSAWAEELGLKTRTICTRLTRGDSVERALREVSSAYTR
jgi:hypothetical protein